MPIFCKNCGKYGHFFYQCMNPITSIGVIAFRYLPLSHTAGSTESLLGSHLTTRRREYLIIRRKDTLGYIDFIRGKYSINNKHYILNMFKQMTEDERKRIIHYAKEEMKLLKAKASEEQKQEKIKKQMLKISNKAKEKNKQPNIKHLVAENESNQNNENVIIQNNVFYDNIVIDLSGNILTGKCKQKLKTGINKDKECGCKIFMDNLCKRHYNLSKN